MSIAEMVESLEDDSALQAAFLSTDVIGVIASFLSVFDLRRSFARVCKQWHVIAISVVQGMFRVIVSLCVHVSHFLEGRLNSQSTVDETHRLCWGGFG